MAPTRKLVAICAVLVLIGGVTGCGGSKPVSAWQKEFKRVKASAVCRNDAFNTTPCGDEMQKVCEAAIGNGSHELEGHNDTCRLAAQIRVQVKKNGEASEVLTQHTSAEEERRSNNLKAEEKVAHEEGALENTSGARKACEEEKRTQEKLHYESPDSPSEPQREAEYERLCGH